MTVEMPEEDMTAEDLDRIKLAKETARARAKREAAAIEAALGSKEGRLFAYMILESTGFFRAPLDRDQSQTIANAAGQSIGCALWAMLLERSPANLALMIKENAR